MGQRFGKSSTRTIGLVVPRFQHTVVGVWVVLGMVVGPVFGSGVPVVVELVLRAKTLEPPEAHIHHLDPAGDNCLVGNTCSGRVISLDRRLWTLAVATPWR